MKKEELPPCGLYRTTQPIGSIPSGKLVYFHNHGDPGPGVYLPESWSTNRTKFMGRGTTLPDLALAATLEPLPREGLYRVKEPFFCCDKKCRTFDADMLVQLGYNGDAKPILFTPFWTDVGISLPEVGQGIELERISKLAEIKIGASQEIELENKDSTNLH